MSRDFFRQECIKLESLEQLQQVIGLPSGGNLVSKILHNANARKDFNNRDLDLYTTKVTLDNNILLRFNFTFNYF